MNEEDTEKEMRLVRGFMPNYDKLVESKTFTYRGLECVLMRFTNKENESWVAGFFPRQFVSAVMEPLWKLGLFSEETTEPITGYLEREEISPNEALRRERKVLKDTIDEILDGVYVDEIQERADKARKIVAKWMWEEQ